MENPTSDDRPQEPAPLLRYDPPWADKLGYHAKLTEELPAGALVYGCAQIVHGATELEMRQAAVRNRVRLQTWETGQNLTALLIAHADDEGQPAADGA